MENSQKSSKTLKKMVYIIWIPRKKAFAWLDYMAREKENLGDIRKNKSVAPLKRFLPGKESLAYNFRKEREM